MDLMIMFPVKMVTFENIYKSDSVVINATII